MLVFTVTGVSPIPNYQAGGPPLISYPKLDSTYLQLPSNIYGYKKCIQNCGKENSREVTKWETNA